MTDFNPHSTRIEQLKKDFSGSRILSLQPMLENLLHQHGIGAEKLLEIWLTDPNAMLSVAFHYLDIGNTTDAERILEHVVSQEGTMVFNYETPSLSDVFVTREMPADDKTKLKGMYFIKKVDIPNKPAAEYASYIARSRRQDMITRANEIVSRKGPQIPLVNGDTLSDRVRDYDMSYRVARYFSRQPEMQIAGVKLPTESFFIYENIIGPNVHLLFADLNQRINDGNITAHGLKNTLTNADIDTLAFFHANPPEIPSQYKRDGKHKEKLMRTIDDNLRRFGITLPANEYESVRRSIEDIGLRLETASNVCFRDATPDNSKISYLNLLESVGDLPSQIREIVDDMKTGEHPDLNIGTVTTVNNFLFWLVEEDRLSADEMISLFLRNHYPIDFANAYRITTMSDDMTHVVDRRLSGYSDVRERMDHQFLLRTLYYTLERDGIYEPLPNIERLSGLVELQTNWDDLYRGVQSTLANHPKELGLFRTTCDLYFQELHTTAYFRNMRFWNLFAGWFIRGEDGFDPNSYPEEEQRSHLLDVEHHSRRAYDALHKEVRGEVAQLRDIDLLKHQSGIAEVEDRLVIPSKYAAGYYDHPGNKSNFISMLKLLQEYKPQLD